MIEILIIIGVVRAFVKKAKERKQNHIIWGFIGAASYYGPVLLMSLVIFPELVMNGVIRVSSVSEAQAYAVILNIIFGVLCCLGAYLYLKSIKTVKEESEVLDDVFKG